MWIRIDEERYDEALGCLPPAYHTHKGFLLGEPHDHRICTVTGEIAPTFAAFRTCAGMFYEHAPQTIAEFKRDEPFWSIEETEED